MLTNSYLSPIDLSQSLAGFVFLNGQSMFLYFITRAGFYLSSNNGAVFSYLQLFSVICPDNCCSLYFPRRRLFLFLSVVFYPSPHKGNFEFSEDNSCFLFLMRQWLFIYFRQTPTIFICNKKASIS